MFVRSVITSSLSSNANTWSFLFEFGGIWKRIYYWAKMRNNPRVTYKPCPHSFFCFHLCRSAWASFMSCGALLSGGRWGEWGWGHLIITPAFASLTVSYCLPVAPCLEGMNTWAGVAPSFAGGVVVVVVIMQPFELLGEVCIPQTLAHNSRRALWWCSSGGADIASRENASNMGMT